MDLKKKNNRKTIEKRALLKIYTPLDANINLFLSVV